MEKKVEHIKRDIHAEAKAAMPKDLDNDGVPNENDPTFDGTVFKLFRSFWVVFLMHLAGVPGRFGIVRDFTPQSPPLAARNSEEKRATIPMRSCLRGRIPGMPRGIPGMGIPGGRPGSPGTTDSV